MPKKGRGQRQRMCHNNDNYDDDTECESFGTHQRGIKSYNKIHNASNLRYNKYDKATPKSEQCNSGIKQCDSGIKTIQLCTADHDRPIKICNTNTGAEVVYYASPEISGFLNTMYDDIVSNMDIDTHISTKPNVVIPIDHNSLNISIEDFNCVFAIFASLLFDEELYPERIALIKLVRYDEFNDESIEEMPAIFLHIIATYDFYMITLLIRLLHHLQLHNILKIFASAIRNIFQKNIKSIIRNLMYDTQKIYSKDIKTITENLPCDIFTGFVLKQNDEGVTMRQYYIPYDIIVNYIQLYMRYDDIIIIVNFEIFKVGYDQKYDPFITTESYNRSMMYCKSSEIDKTKQCYRCDEFLTHAECNCDFEASPIFPQGCTTYTFKGKFHYGRQIVMPKNIDYIECLPSHSSFLENTNENIIGYYGPFSESDEYFNDIAY